MDVIKLFQRMCDTRDPRVQQYFLGRYTLIPLSLSIGFWYFIRIAGPKFMKNRKPYELKNVIAIYNAVQIVLNGWFFLKALPYSLSMSFICDPIDYSTSEDAIHLTNLFYYYYLLKIFDFTDTIFFVFRKKYGHISFLHVYHHIGMVMLSWIGLNWYAGGQGLHIGTLNAFVHVVMYFYYLLAALDYPIKNSITAKKNLTRLQLLHHIIVAFMWGMSIVRSDCAYPRFPLIMMFPPLLFFIILFLNFYIRAYIINQKNKV